MASIAEPQERKRGSMARVIIASSAGTAFEWYDFFIFGSLAPVISKVAAVVIHFVDHLFAFRR